jgi:hypothetical protein
LLAPTAVGRFLDAWDIPSIAQCETPT